MINKRELTTNIVKILSDEIFKDKDYQIINGYDLLKIPEKLLKFPRIIVDMVIYNDSDYDYLKTKYNSDKDVVEYHVTKVPELTYRFRVYNDSKNQEDALDMISKIHFFFSNPYRTILDGKIQVLRTGTIVDVSSGINDDYVVGYQFTMDFNMEEKDILDVDYVEKIDFNINMK